MSSCRTMRWRPCASRSPSSNPPTTPRSREGPTSERLDPQQGHRHTITFELKDGAGLILAERRLQIEEEGYSAEEDDSVGSDELLQAGIAYAVASLEGDAQGVDWWPWRDKYWKPTRDRVRDLTKAGALIAAAIDAELRRRERVTISPVTPEDA